MKEPVTRSQQTPQRANALEGLPAQGNLAKASLLRGYIAHLERAQKLGAVRSRVSEKTRALIDAPPPVTQWIDAGALEDVYEALGAIDGEAGVRRMVRAAIKGSMMPLVRPVLQGILRVFGSSPAALLTHADLAFRSSLQGVRTRYRSLGDGEGEVEVRYVGHRAPPMAFAAWHGTLEFALELCGVKGSVKLVEVNDGGAIGRFDVRWQA